jgi:hypothetical protein
MNRADRLVDRAANRLQRLARDFAADGGAKGQVAQELAADAAFLRKLKPSLMRARLRGEAPTNTKPDEGVVAPSAPQLGARPKPARAGGPNPLLVVGAAFVVGIAVAKLIDWRGHAHPRD